MKIDQIAKQAEEFVKQYRPLLTERTTPLFPLNNMELRGGKLVEKFEEGADAIVFTENDEIVGQETKAIRSFLTRNNDGSDPSGTVHFEIMNEQGNDKGWLFEMLFPELWNAEERHRTSAVTPGELFFVLYDANDKIFCVICFEDVLGLLEALQREGLAWGWDIKSPNEWNLKRLEEITKGLAKANNIRKAPGQYLIHGTKQRTAYMWHVPFSRIREQGKACVTMIGEKPSIISDDELARTRYEYLEQASGGKRITAEELKRHNDVIEHLHKKTGHNVYLWDNRYFNNKNRS